MNFGQVLALHFNHNFLLITLDDEFILVRMKGETPEAHAAAILAYYNYTKTDEDTFKVKFGFDLRQSFIERFKSNDKPSSHRAVGKGLFDVKIPIARSLVAQIESVKNPISSNLLSGNGNSNVNLTALRQPTPVPKNATPAVREFYREIDLFQTELLNFSYRGIQIEDVRTDYLKTIKFASDEFIELVKSGKITPEEGALRANKLRNVIFEMSRRKDFDLGRSLAEYYKPEAKPFEWFLDRYSQQRYSLSFSSLTSQAQKNDVFLDVIMAAGRDNKDVTELTKKLGKAGKVCLVASLAISVYNVATAEDKTNAVGREGSSILGGIAGGAAGGAATGLICGPGAPVCSAIGIFVGGAVGAFLASGGYDWLTSK